MYEESQQTQTNQWPGGSYGSIFQKHSGIESLKLSNLQDGWSVNWHLPSSNELTRWSEDMRIVPPLCLFMLRTSQIRGHFRNTIVKMSQIWLGVIITQLWLNRNHKTVMEQLTMTFRSKVKDAWRTFSKLATVSAWRSSACISHFLQNPMKITE